MSYWWKSSTDDITRLDDDPNIAFREFKKLYEHDPEGTFGIVFANNCKLQITGTETAEVAEAVRKWIEYVEGFDEEKEGG